MPGAGSHHREQLSSPTLKKAPPGRSHPREKEKRGQEGALGGSKVVAPLKHPLGHPSLCPSWLQVTLMEIQPELGWAPCAEEGFVSFSWRAPE